MRRPELHRLLRLISGLCILLIAGLCYAWLAARFWGIPCVFRLITGLKCPGCGVTGMCLSLLRGDISGAFRQNMAVFCLLPAGMVLFFSRAVAYVKTGSRQLKAWENVLAWIMVIILVAFGILRNLIGI